MSMNKQFVEKVLKNNFSRELQEYTMEGDAGLEIQRESIQRFS